MACGRAQTFWTEPGRVATAYSAGKYKDHNEQYKSAELGNLLNPTRPDLILKNLTRWALPTKGPTDPRAGLT